MSIASAIASAYAKILTFRGRATPREFWSFYVFQVVLAGALAYWLYYEAGLAQVMPLIEGNTGVLVGAFILTQLPGLSLIVRRLHDSGRSAWWLLITAIPVFGALALFVLLIQPSDAALNRYDVAGSVTHAPQASQPVPVPVESRSNSPDVHALYTARIAGLNKNPSLSA